ncbi:MAG: rod-binding protein [Proteobacteria bacterium]|nr:rod-binding protein [Pseudomonadota bacterium]MDA1356129.1 rod-binding protein [Pseudomonadota bacterium]
MDVTQLRVMPVQASTVSPADVAGSGKGTAQARKVAEDFEAFFISMFVETMFSGIETDGVFGGGHGEDVYRSLLNQEVGKSIARTGGIGIADSVVREIIKMQESA